MCFCLVVVVVGFFVGALFYGVCCGFVFGVGLFFGFCLVVVVVVDAFFQHGCCLLSRWLVEKPDDFVEKRNIFWYLSFRDFLQVAV